MTDAERNCRAVQRMLALMDMLRDPQHGCPWDLKQDFRSIAPHTLEEVYEVIDAIEQGSPDQLKAELGDLLFQIVFYARLGKEQGAFDFADIATAITDKLLRRHPHVFPDASFDSFGKAPVTSAEAVSPKWEAIKSAERRAASTEKVPSAMDDVPLALPAVLRAAKLQKRAAAKGFDWPDSEGVFAKLQEEIAELEQAMDRGQESAVAEELGDLLFTAINLSRHLNVEPEQALRAANAKFEERFRRVETLAARDGHELQTLTPAELDEYWQAVKLAQKSPA